MPIKEYHLSKNDVIGLITPSSPMFPGRLEAGIKFIEENGFRAKLGKHIKDSNRFLAGLDIDRAADIMDFIFDDEVKVLMATGGGYGSQRLLPLLDHHAIKINPKPIVGFSDTTALQVGLIKSTNLVSYSGFIFNCLDDGALDPLIHETLINCLTGRSFAISEGKCIHSGHAKGQLIGGNLDCFLGLIGTPYEPDFRNSILLIEEVRTEPYKLDSKLTQLKQAGVFDKISGLIFGTFKDCNANYYPDRDGTLEDIIQEWSAKFSIPCIKDFPYGHIDRRCVLPIGAEITLDALQCRVSIE